MAFAEGQQVRVKRGQGIGRIDRKLVHLQDMYVILMEGNPTPAKKLAHESELELLMRGDARQSAQGSTAVGSALKN
jgi:hypothetical protein